MEDLAESKKRKKNNNKTGRKRIKLETFDEVDNK